MNQFPFDSEENIDGQNPFEDNDEAEFAEADANNSAMNTADNSPAAAEDDPQVLKDRWLRAAAELDNMRKRTKKRIETERREERETLLRSFLEVLDNLERALDSHAGEEPNSWIEGMAAIRQQMLDNLKRFDVEPFDDMGKPFDPNRHEAVAMAKRPDQPDGSVAEVVQVGYEFSDNSILRPAKVLVTRNDSA